MSGRLPLGGLFGGSASSGIVLKSRAELAMMREAGRIVAQVLERMREVVRPGVSTAELDRIADEMIRQAGAIASFKGYPNAQPGGPVYPAATCISVNDELVHGIPGPRRLAEGDIVSVDVGAIVKGWHGDGAWTFPVGTISAEAQRLLRVTEQSLYDGIAQARVGKRTGDIAAAVQATVEAAGFAVVREYTSHGVGRKLHEGWQMLNYGKAGRGIPLRPGLTLALEPMVQAGGWETQVLPDQWTVASADGSLSAHFEHTIAVTDDGPQILTQL